MITERVSLGPLETTLLFELESEGASVFALSEAARVLRTSRQRAAEVIYRLKKKGRILEVRKGRYVLVPARAGREGYWAENVYRVVDAILAEPYYVGFWSALNYWGLTEQVPRVVHVVIPGRRKGFEFQGQGVRFVTLRQDRIFGFTTEALRPGEFRVSDREKTVLDCLLVPAYCGGITEIAKALSEGDAEFRWTRMEAYVRRLRVDAVRRRLGYILEVLDLAASVRRRMSRGSRGFLWLDPSAPRERLGYSREWGLILNVPSDELREAGRY